MKKKPGDVVPIRPGLARQIGQLIEARDADPELGFMAQMMCCVRCLAAIPARRLSTDASFSTGFITGSVETMCVNHTDEPARPEALVEVISIT